MRIKIFHNSSDDRCLDKDIEELFTITGQLKMECPIEDPVIRVAGDIANAINANYAYIEEFGRYYYIRGKKAIRDNLYELTFHIDVLSTYKEGIRESEGVIERQENNWNLYLNDGSLKTYTPTNTFTRNFPNGFTAGSYVLIMSGS